VRQAISGSDGDRAEAKAGRRELRDWAEAKQQQSLKEAQRDYPRQSKYRNRFLPDSANAGPNPFQATTGTTSAKIGPVFAKKSKALFQQNRTGNYEGKFEREPVQNWPPSRSCGQNLPGKAYTIKKRDGQFVATLPWK